MPLQFAWRDLRTDFFEFDAGHGYDRIMSYMFGIGVFRNSGYCRIVHQDLADVDECLDLEVSMGNYSRIFLVEVWSE